MCYGKQIFLLRVVTKNISFLRLLFSAIMATNFSHVFCSTLSNGTQTQFEEEM